jgi:KDO2-lipid IV(A) lauroyltransferase
MGKVFKHLRYLAEAGAVLLGVLLLKPIGVDAASWLIGRLMRMLGPMLSPSKRAARNIAACFPEKSEAERRDILLGMWENLGRTLGEYPHLGKLWTLGENGRVEVVNPMRFFDIRASNPPCILISAHMANWEMLPIGARQYGMEVALVHRTVNNPYVRGLLAWIRKVSSSRFLPKGKGAARMAVAEIEAGRPIGMLIDQRMSNGMAVPIFGRPAMTAPGPAQLALRFGCPIVPVQVERTRGARFRITLYDPLAVEKTGDQQADIYKVLVQINDAVESWVRARPDQWLWIHDRWQVPPLGMPPTLPESRAS